MIQHLGQKACSVGPSRKAEQVYVIFGSVLILGQLVRGVDWITDISHQEFVACHDMIPNIRAKCQVFGLDVPRPDLCSCTVGLEAARLNVCAEPRIVPGELVGRGAIQHPIAFQYVALLVTCFESVPCAWSVESTGASGECGIVVPVPSKHKIKLFLTGLLRLVSCSMVAGVDGDGG